MKNIDDEMEGWYYSELGDTEYKMCPYCEELITKSEVEEHYTGSCRIKKNGETMLRMLDPMITVTGDNLTILTKDHGPVSLGPGDTMQIRDENRTYILNARGLLKKGWFERLTGWRIG